MWPMTKLDLLQLALLAQFSSGKSRELTPEDAERKRAQEEAYEEWRRSGGSFSGLGVQHSCRGGCPYCGGWR